MHLNKTRYTIYRVYWLAAEDLNPDTAGMNRNSSQLSYAAPTRHDKYGCGAGLTATSGLSPRATGLLHPAMQLRPLQLGRNIITYVAKISAWEEMIREWGWGRRGPSHLYLAPSLANIERNSALLRELRSLLIKNSVYSAIPEVLAWRERRRL